MAATVKGGKKAAATNMKRYGSDYYRRIGSIGGAASRAGGFASSKIGADGLTGMERARLAGTKGGSISRRGPSAL